jgi:uncharacterized protein with ACT and thioredoxin-like domain
MEMLNYKLLHAQTIKRVPKFMNFNFIYPRKEDAFPYYEIFFVGEYEKLLNNIKSTDIVLDAGVHFGFFSYWQALRQN